MLRAAFTSRPHGIKRVALARAVAIAISFGREGGNNPHQNSSSCTVPPLSVRRLCTCAIAFRQLGFRALHNVAANDQSELIRDGMPLGKANFGCQLPYSASLGPALDGEDRARKAVHGFIASRGCCGSTRQVCQ